MLETTCSPIINMPTIVWWVLMSISILGFATVFPLWLLHIWLELRKLRWK